MHGVQLTTPFLTYWTFYNSLRFHSVRFNRVEIYSAGTNKQYTATLDVTLVKELITHDLVSNAYSYGLVKGDD